MGTLILSLIAAAALMGWCVGFMMGDWMHTREPRRRLPPATPRAIARVRRSRADIRAALARAGIRLHEPPAPSQHDRRQWIPLPEGNFDDNQETR